jgi:hypothetical protein
MGQAFMDMSVDQCKEELDLLWERFDFEVKREAENEATRKKAVRENAAKVCNKPFANLKQMMEV